MSFDFYSGNVQYHQNLCLPFALAFNSHGKITERTNRLCLAIKSIWCHVVFHSSRFFCVPFFFLVGLVFVALELHRANGKFSILRWCYDWCTSPKCMNDSIVVTVIQFFCSRFFFRFLHKILRKVGEDTKMCSQFCSYIRTHLSKNRNELNKRGCELEHSPVTNATKNRALNQSHREEGKKCCSLHSMHMNERQIKHRRRIDARESKKNNNHTPKMIPNTWRTIRSGSSRPTEI